MALSAVSLMGSFEDTRRPRSPWSIALPYWPGTLIRGGNTVELKSLSEQKSLLATLPPGKRARLYRLLYEFGPGNGTLMLLQIVQGLEAGPPHVSPDVFPTPASKDPDYQFRLAAEAGYSALACQIGLAEKYYPDYAGKVPLILKVNGKTDIPSGSKAFSSCNASVEDGVRLGGDAIGFTLVVGCPLQAEALAEMRRVREECDRFGMPLVVWSYPRGEAVESKGGQNSFYAIDYAARMAMEMGADLVKINMPKIDPAKDKEARPPITRWKSTSPRRSGSASSPPGGRSSSCPGARGPTTSRSSATPARSWR